MHVSNREIRAILTRTLRPLNALYQPHFKRRFVLRDLRSVTSLIEAQLRAAKRGNRAHFSKQFDVATCSITAIALLSMSVYSHRYREELLPADWLDPSGRPNANHVLQALLVQLTNYSISALLLLQTGLDNPARALQRVIMELAHQTLVLMANKEDMCVYITGHDGESSNKAWFKLFGRGLLNRKLHELETRIGFDADLAEYMKGMRRESEQFYSQAVHHSFIATVIGAYATPLAARDRMSLGIFATENLNVEAPLRQLNTTLWYFLSMFFTVLDKIHGVRPRNAKEGMWLEAFMMYMCVRVIYLKVYAKEEDSRKTTRSRHKQRSPRVVKARQHRKSAGTSPDASSTRRKKAAASS